MKHIFRRWYVICAFSEGIHVRLVFFRDIALCQRMVLTHDHGKQLLIEVLIAVIGFFSDDTVTWDVGFLCQIPEHVCELHSGIIHVKAHVKIGILGSSQ